MNKDHNHIITGNLEIIANNKLRKQFSKGVKYQERIMKKLGKAYLLEYLLKGSVFVQLAWCQWAGPE